MAESPSHKFGQIIGDLLEATVHGPLAEVAERHGLYLDYKHPRPARGDRSKVAWLDNKGNKHDLDFVLEHGGSEHKQGSPKAFIETAWRRYTKHSRNKAQEMQGAIGPLAETYSKYNPFLGVVVAGVFTEGSLQQLRSHGFSILYFPYETVIAAFATVGISAAFDEDSKDDDMREKVTAYLAVGQSGRERITKALHNSQRTDIAAFVSELESSLRRLLTGVLIAALHGPSCEVTTIDEAVKFIQDYSESSSVIGFVQYEVSVRYSNGDKITGEFEDKSTAVRFLRGLT